MTPLDRYFQEGSAELLEELKQARDLSQLVQAATVHLRNLIGPESQFGGELTTRDQRLATYYFNSFVSALSLLAQTQIKFEAPAMEHASAEKPRHRIGPETLAIPLASAVGAALVPWVIPAILVGFASGGVATFVLDRAGKRTSTVEEGASPADAAYFEPFVDAEKVRASIQDAIVNFDKLRSEIEDIRADALRENLTRPVNLEEMPNLLPFLHELLGFQQTLADLPIELKTYLPIVQRILRGYGIEAVQYAAGVNDEMFERQSAFGEAVSVPCVLKPALVRGSTVLRPGLVMLPEA